MSVRSFRSVWLVALIVGSSGLGCAEGSGSTEDLPPPVVDSSVDSSGDDTSINPEDTGSGDTGGEVATDTGPAGCKTNADCVSDPAGKFCLVGGDGGKSYCVPCLPAPFDECGPGTYCSDMSYTCEAGCKTTSDCTSSPGGDAGGDAGADGGTADADAAGDGGSSLTCDTVKHRCVGCVADPDCPAGFICDRPTGACVPGCTTTKPCPTGKDCCSGSCFDTQKDVKNCGSCGNACATPPNATAGCSAGVCGVGTCNTGYGDCNTIASDGCETNLLSNKDNCGACGTVCALSNATAACTAGSCTIATCNGGFDDCDKIASTGCETNLKTLDNCGSCGTLCLIPNGTGTCSTGTCQIASCNAGYGNCDGVASNGCETNLAAGSIGPGGSIVNCGTCGTNCAVANGTPICSAGACQVGGCTAPDANCNGTYSDGCETNTQISVSNCGGCGNACSTVGGTPSCSAGTCSIACSAGFGNCDTLASNGCEKNLMTDKDNCNTCGNVCPTSGTVLASACSSGACTVGTCAAGTYDRNGIFSDGCECTEDSHGNNCGAATDVGTIGVDGTTTRAGNLAGPSDSDEDWFKITFAVGPSCNYSPRVTLSGTGVKMQVYTTCGGSTASGSYTCGGGSEPTNSIPGGGVDSWEFRMSTTCADRGAIDPTPAYVAPFLKDNAPSVVYVRVFRAASSASCYPYTLTIYN